MNRERPRSPERVTTYQEAVSYLEETPRFTEKHTVAQTARMLEYLGAPEKSFRVIHAAGSNGKGSVCSMLASVLDCAGQKWGLFLSPHLVTIRERFVIAGEMVTEAQFLEDFRETAQMLCTHPDCPHPSYFEYLFLMAMLRFRKSGVETAVLETGLGGRLDATNAVAKPDLCVITAICLDHTEYLGETIPEIAAEKAGIIKPGVPVVYDASDPEAAAVIRRTAQERHSPAFAVLPQQTRHLRREQDGIAFTCTGAYDLFHLKVHSPAAYQAQNAALAACAAERFLAASDKGPDPQRRRQIEDGIAAWHFAGRMEEKPGGIVLDGAHNPAGMAVFLSSAAQMVQGRQILIFACMKDKNYREMVRCIAQSGLWETVIVTGAGTQRQAPPQELCALLAAQMHSQVLCEIQPEKALEKAKELQRGGQRIFAAGSLYLVGILENRL